MANVGQFLMDRPYLVVVPVVCLIAWNIHVQSLPREETDPWGRRKASTTTQLAAVMHDIGEHLGIGSAKAAGNGEATQAFRKAEITAIYARSGYRKKAAAARLGMSLAQFQATLRRYGVIEWPEGHKAL